MRRFSSLVFLVACLALGALEAASASEPGSGRYAEDCTAKDSGFLVSIEPDGMAKVVAGGAVHDDLLTSYSFFGVRTPADFHIAVLFEAGRAPVEGKDGEPGWLEIWKGEAAYYLLVNGEAAPRYHFCEELAGSELRGPSFECADAQGAVEELICRDEALARQDRALAAAYRKALGRVSKDREQADHLRAEQRGWIKGRNDCWKGEDLRHCVAESYSDRHATLLARYGLAEAALTEVWTCGDEGYRLYVTAFMTEPPTVTLVRGDDTTTAIQRRAASGVRFEAPFGVLFWSKGEEAFLEWPQGEKERCRYRGPLGD